VKYVILIYDNPSSREVWLSLPPEQRAAGLAVYERLNEELDAAGERIVSEALAGEQLARRVALRDGRTIVTDGPFAEAKEQLAGFYLIDCETPDRAVEIAARIPEAEFGAVEIRPVLDLGGPEM
jgi:hypothetical protein